MRHLPDCRITARRGLTLVEVMVALVLVAVGLLGIAGASALSLRALAEHAGALRATRRASLRLARLASDGCLAARDGAEVEGTTGLRERWVLGRAEAGALTVDDSLSWVSRGRSRQLVVHGALLC